MDDNMTPEYRRYLERRYVDLKQVYEAVVSYFPPDAYEENHLFETITAEFNYLAEVLGYEDDTAFLSRLLSHGEDDELDELDDEEDDLL